MSITSITKENQEEKARSNPHGNQHKLKEEKGQQERGRQKKCALNHLRQAPLLRHNNSHLLHLYLHHQFPIKFYSLHNLPNKWTLFPTNKNTSLKNTAAHTIIILPRLQSAERSQPLNLTWTSSLPSLSPSAFSSQELFPATQKGKQDPPAVKNQISKREKN